MKRFLLSTAIVCLLALIANSQGDKTSQRFNGQAILPELTADPETTVNVPLTVTNMDALQSLSVSYTFDPAILTYLNFSFAGGVLTESFYNRQVNLIGNNKIQFVFTAKSTFFMYSGGGIIGSINFETGLFGTSPLIFTELLVNGTTYLANTINGKVTITDCLNAVANAGQDASILSGQAYLLNGSAANHSGVQWATQGDGVFNNISILSPFYTPGAQDIANGGAVLCMTAFGFAPCIDDIDCMTLSIVPVATPQAVLPVLFANPGSTVSVPVRANLLQSVLNLTVTFTYDPVVLTYGSFSFANSVLTSGLYNRQFNQPAPGVLQFIFTAKNPSFTYSGSGQIAKVEFTAGSFGTSPLVFTEFTVNSNSYIGNVINGQIYISNCLNASANAGNDVTICEDENFTLNGTASNYQSVQWVTSGDGTFSNPAILNPTYTPGNQDITTGNVELCLTAFTNAPCLNNTSCMVLTISALPDVTLEPFTGFCAGDEAFTLTGGLPEGGIYYIDGVEATTFNPAIAGTFEVLYVYVNQFGCSGEDEQDIVVNPTPQVELLPFGEFCEGDETFTLTGGLPEGGIYYIDGVEATTFNPAIAGTFEVLYVYVNQFGCSGEDEQDIVVNPTPQVELLPFGEFCEGDETFTLTGGLPEGGIYYIDGVEATTFNPAIAGTFEVLYVYTNEFGCTGSEEGLIIVNPSPMVVLSPFGEFCEGDEAFILTGGSPEGGIYFVNGGEATIFDPANAGIYAVLYVYTNESGCSGTDGGIIIVNPTPQVTLEQFTEFCEGDNEITLTGGLPVGGIYYINGIEATIFDPASVGSYTVLYVYTNEFGCTGSAEEVIVVNPLPIVTCPDNTVICINAAPFQLTGAIPAGGNYSGNGVADNMFNPEMAGLGTHVITYNYTDENGCSGSCSFSIGVTPLPTVNAGNDATICQDGSAYQLNGSVENGGSYFWFTLQGSGDFDNQFSLNAVYTPGPVDYLLGSVELCLQATSIAPCSDDVVDCMTLYFFDELTVTCPPNLSACINAAPFQLTGAIPAGGNYSNGVADNMFNPEMAGLGTHVITYNYTDENGCSGSCSFSSNSAANCQCRQ
jgi:hypothetical protein